jgi:hypothetical protein
MYLKIVFLEINHRKIEVISELHQGQAEASLNSQNRRSLNSARSSSEKINGIREFSNSIRSSYSGSTRGLSNYSSADGRRSGYSAPPVSFNPVRGRGMSAPFRSSSYGGSSNSGGSYSSGGSGSSYSSGGSSGGSSGVVRVWL